MAKFSFVDRSVNPQTPEETQLVMVYELGKLFECLYGTRLTLPGYREHAQTELADYVSMCRMLSEQEGWDFDVMTEHLSGGIVYGHNSEELLAKMMVLTGKLVRALHYMKRFNEPRGDSPSLCMESIIRQVYHLCDVLKYDFWDVCDLGVERYKERMTDLQRHGVNETLKKEFRRKATPKEV